MGPSPAAPTAIAPCPPCSPASIWKTVDAGAPLGPSSQRSGNDESGDTLPTGVGRSSLRPTRLNIRLVDARSPGCTPSMRARGRPILRGGNEQRPKDAYCRCRLPVGRSRPSWQPEARSFVRTRHPAASQRRGPSPLCLLRASALRTLSDMACAWRLQLLLVRSVARGYLQYTTDTVAFGSGHCFIRSLHYPRKSPCKCAAEVCGADLLLIDA
jgi:hypothetical protein